MENYLISAAIIIVLYIINLFLNRWLFFKAVEQDSDSYNELLKFFCFISFVGTVILIIDILINSSFMRPPKKDYKPKSW